MTARRRLLEERIEWLDGFPHRMTIGALLKALRVITQHQLRELPAIDKKEVKS